MKGEQHNFDSQLHALTDEARRAEAIEQRRQRSNRAMSAARREPSSAPLPNSQKPVRPPPS